jgi:hypothetical protein
MAYEPKNGDSALFKNDKKGNEKAPDMKGYVVMHRDVKAGEKLELAMWSREGTKGGWFWSGKVSDPRPQKQNRPAEDPASELGEERIPF